MSVSIHTKGFHLSDAERVKVEEKAEKLPQYARRLTDESVEIRVEFEHKDTKSLQDSITCSITIFAPNATLHAEEVGAQVLEAFDKAMPKINPQIEKYKGKHVRR